MNPDILHKITGFLTESFTLPVWLFILLCLGCFTGAVACGLLAGKRAFIKDLIQQVNAACKDCSHVQERLHNVEDEIRKKYLEERSSPPRNLHDDLAKLRLDSAIAASRIDPPGPGCKCLTKEDKEALNKDYHV